MRYFNISNEAVIVAVYNAFNQLSDDLRYSKEYTEKLHHGVALFESMMKERDVDHFEIANCLVCAFLECPYLTAKILEKVFARVKK